MDAFKDLLRGIGQVIVFSQPTTVDAVETIGSFDHPVASIFARFGGKQDTKLTMSWIFQDTSPTSPLEPPLLGLSGSAELRNPDTGRRRLQIHAWLARTVLQDRAKGLESPNAS